MATGTAGTAAREYPQQMLHYLRKTLTHENITDTTVGIVPAGACIIPAASGFLPYTDFNGTTPTLDVGISGEVDAWMDGGDIDTVGTFVALDQADAGFYCTADTTVIAKVISGGGISTGEGILTIVYTVNNDG